MQRLKLYNQLDIQQSEGTNMNNCCAQDLESNDEDIELVESSFTNSSHLNEEERSTLYYISGHVALKEKIGINMVENSRKSRKSKGCDKIFLQAYKLIYESTNYHFNNIEKINRRFSNCFFKASVKRSQIRHPRIRTKNN